MSENPTETLSAKLRRIKAARAANPGPAYVPPLGDEPWCDATNYMKQSAAAEFLSPWPAAYSYVTADEMRKHLNLEPLTGSLQETFRNTYEAFVRASETTIAMALLGKTLGMHSPSQASEIVNKQASRRAANEIAAAQRGPFADARRAAIAAFCENGTSYTDLTFRRLATWLEKYEELRGGLTRPSDAALRATAGEGPTHYAALAAYERARSSRRETVDRTHSHPGAPNRRDLPRLAEQQRAKSAEKTFAADQGFGGFVQRERIKT